MYYTYNDQFKKFPDNMLLHNSHIAGDEIM